MRGLFASNAGVYYSSATRRPDMTNDAPKTDQELKTHEKIGYMALGFAAGLIITALTLSAMLATDEMLPEPEHGEYIGQ